MDIHSFIDRLRKDKKNKELVKDIADSITALSEKRDDNLILHIPDVPSDLEKRRKLSARFIHGSIFEEYVLKAAVDDKRVEFNVKGKDEENVNKKIQKMEKRFKDLYGKEMETVYKDTMIKAGSDAWEILSENLANHSAFKDTEIAFEEIIFNHRTKKLTKNLRADFVARSGRKAFLVDFKYSSLNRKDYEQNWLVNGLTQVLIYAILIGEDPVSLTVSVLVYYARIGGLVLYSTDKKIHDSECVRTLKKIAEIRDEDDDETEILYDRMSKLAL